MKKGLKILMIIFILMAAVAGLYAYIVNSRRMKLDNYPYEPDTPAPPAHEGTFTSEHGTMIFNGDGESIIFDFDEELAKLCGLPQGEQEGTYVFLSGNLPPHGYVDVRYDTAFELEITCNDQTVMIDLGLALDDGSSAQIGTGTVSETRIPLLFKINGKSVSIIFEK